MFRYLGTTYRHLYLRKEDISHIFIKFAILIKENFFYTFPTVCYRNPMLFQLILIQLTTMYESYAFKGIFRRALISLMCQSEQIDYQDLGVRTVTLPYWHSAQWLYMMSPCSLRLSVRDLIRNVLRKNLVEKIRCFLYPRSLKSYLNIVELDSLIQEYCTAEHYTAITQCFRWDSNR